MKKNIIIALLSASLLLPGACGCSSPTSQFDALRGASAASVAGTSTVEVLE